MYIKSLLKSNKLLNDLYLLLTNKKASYLLSKRDTWEQIQCEKLAHLLVYARDHSKFYSSFLAGREIAANNSGQILKELPLLTKDIIREQGFNIYSDVISEDWKVWGNTGGSTGEPLKFPRLTNDQWNEPVHQYLTYKYLAGNNKVCRKDVIVSISGERIPEEYLSKNVFYLKAVNFPWGSYRFSTLYMTEENLIYYVKSINDIKPSFIRAYSAGILTLAQFIYNNNLIIEFKCKGIYLTSEVFTEANRKFIEMVFNCPVIGQYGHTEMSVYAIQHKEDSIYECMPLYGYTEVLDNNGKQVKLGETGEIVVTGFNQIGMPFIRYKTGDLAIYKGEKNGIVYIDAIQGRTVDYLYDRNGKKVFLTGAIFGGHIKAFNHIAQWQLVQKERGKVCVSVIKGVGYSKVIEDEIYNFFEGFNISAIIDYVEFIPKQANGKQKFLIQQVS